MVTLSAISTHVGSSYRLMGRHRAVIARHALLGDCTTFRENARSLLSPSYWRRPGCLVPISLQRRRDSSAADLAVDVSRRLMESRPSLDTDTVSALIYCHEAPDERVSESTAGRLQFELNLRRANPFAISQAHNTSLLIALDLSLGLVEGPEAAEHVLLVASDKLLFGGPSDHGRRLMFGDVAAAALVSRTAAEGWSVEHVALRQFPTPCDAMSTWPRACVSEYGAFGAQVIRAALRETALSPDSLHAVITTTPDARFAAELHRAAGLPEQLAQGHSSTRRQRSSSADLLFALSEAEPLTPSDSRVLAWACGNNGEFACCVLKRI